MAQAFAGKGAIVIAMARRLERLEELVTEIEGTGGKAHAIRLDVCDDASIDASLKEILSKYGKVDVLINCAGASQGGPVTELTNEAWDFTLQIDLTSVFKMTRAYAKPMKDVGYGRIINISSVYGLLGTNQNESAYHASKAGVINFTRAAAGELAPAGITVNAICPGYFETELTTQTLNSDEFQVYMDQVVPLKRYGNPEELNAAAIFLASQEASYVTGVALPVDGGWSSVK